MQANLRTQEPSLVSDLTETPHRDLPRKGFAHLWRETIAPRYRWYCLVNTWRILRAAIYSCCGHIQLQSPKEASTAGVGPAFEKAPTQSGQKNTRTLARAFYIEMLLAKWEWLDIVDLRIFLMGFDAGEQWILHTKGTGTEIPTLPSSWLHLAEQKCGTVADKINNNSSLSS
jgi:hypothetical protein